MSTGWWLIGNAGWGMHTAYADSGTEAKVDVRSRIAETYLGEGMSPSAARRAASSYRVFLIAGPLDEATARAAQKAWDACDTEPAERLARQHRNRRRKR